MKSIYQITIAIDPPITEHCSQCSFECHFSFNSMRLNCPECGARSMRRGPRNKIKPIYVSAMEGSFNILDFNDKEWQYTFYNVPGEDPMSFIVPDELDYSDPADLAVELKEIIDKYLINSSKSKIAMLVNILDNDDCRDVQDRLRTEKERIDLETRLFEIYSVSDWLSSTDE